MPNVPNSPDASDAPNAPKSLYLVDGHAQIYRAYYAPFRTLTAPSGEPTRATYVFCQMLLNLLRDRRPDYLAMVLDADERKLQRRQIYPDYKAQREPPPEDMHPQEERIVSILQAAGVPMLRQEGYEADDIIATLVRSHAGDDLDIYLVSRDKDLEQLLGPRVTLYDPFKDELITPSRLLEKKGWRPDQAIDAQILTGDTTDNVPGIPGIGPKTAAKLIQKYGSVSEIINHVDELTPKQRENVQAFIPQIDMVRQLITLVNDVPVQLNLQQADPQRFNWPRVQPIFAELGFQRLQEQLPAGDTSDSDSQTPVPIAVAPAHDTTAAALSEPDGGTYTLINTEPALRELADTLSQLDTFALDTETTGLNAIDCDLVGLSFAWEVGRGCYVPVRSVYGTTLPIELVRDVLGPILANEHIRKVGQNIKYDLLVLRQAGFTVGGPLFDTMIAASLADPGASSYGLDRLTARLLGHQMIPITDLIGTGKQQLQIDQVPLEQVAEYASEDADYTWRLYELFAPRLRSAGVDELFNNVEMPLLRVLVDMEAAGISIDVDFLRTMNDELRTRAGQIVDQVHTIVGHPFNLDSPKQLSEVLFDELGCRVVRRTKTTRSTDADTLEVLGRETGQPIFKLLLEYRELQKLRGTYTEALPAQLSQRTGRIHTSYHQAGTVTGRLSSSDPNLQNIPVRTEAGRQIRRAFVPGSAADTLIVADYSQVELRILAHYSEDEALIEAFREDQDIHAFVAAQVNDVPLDSVTREMRGRAKAVNFGIIYGQTAFGLAQSTGMTRTEAQGFIDAYFARYPRISGFMRSCVEGARNTGWVRTILGRRRPIENIASRSAAVRNQAERFAINTVVQGSAADLIKLAMLRLHERITADRLPLRMLLQVHDELVCEGPAAQADRWRELLAEVMSGALELRVPLKVDVSCGANWLEAK